MPAGPHIFTLTGNLLAERTLEFPTWEAGRTQRAARESFQVGGKGINVAKMLTRLRVANTALCFTGGATGTECEAWLRAHGFTFRAFGTSAATRAGTVVRDEAGTHGETTFLGPDAIPDAATVRACADFLDAQHDGDVLALCGSFPGWIDSSFDPLRAALERWLGRRVLVADTYGPPLAWCAARSLPLIKVNAHELAGIASDLAHLPASARAERWVVTDGAKPVQFRDRDGATGHAAPPSVREVSPTGSGDVLFACLIEALFWRNESLATAVQFALPYAAANAAHPGIAAFPESAAT
jgi:1-phosphofructokinase